MRRFILATALAIALSTPTGLSAGAAGPTSVTGTGPVATIAGSASAIPWLCRIFGLCCER